MIDRVALGALPPKPHTVFRDPDGALLYEEMYTRGGFHDAFTYFYHRHPITAARSVAPSTRRHPVARAAEGHAHAPLRRRLYDTQQVAGGGTMLEARRPLLFNDDVVVSFACADASDDVLFGNGDGDELWYLVDGEATLESPCGALPVRGGDYVFVPRGLPHRWRVGAPLRALGFELPDGLKIPSEYRNPVGQLRMDAPYTHRDFVRPAAPPATFGRAPEGPVDLVVKRGGAFTHFELEHTPFDVVGWEGFVYPFAFAIEKFQPKTGLVHLPPTIHTTFASRGVLVCSFVPRVTDFHPQAIPCPYPHSSVDCDEIILYLRGNFTSRRGVGPGAISLHPAGVPHGPHPGAYEASIGATRTDELAVMMDCYKPLVPTTESLGLESVAYHESWSTPR